MERLKVRVKFGHEVFFESCIVGCDDRGVMYVRTTGLDGPVQLVRIKPSEFVAVAAHITSRVANPKQGVTARNRKEFVPLDERLTRPEWLDEEEEEVAEEPPVQLVPPGTQFRQRHRVKTVAVIPQPEAPTPPPQYRVRRRYQPEET